MKEVKLNSSTEDKKEYKRWRKSIEKDGITKSVSVEECENGYIISICREGYEGDKWIYDDKKYISTKNPLEGEEAQDKELEMKEEILESIKAMGL